MNQRCCHRGLPLSIWRWSPHVRHYVSYLSAPGYMEVGMQAHLLSLAESARHIRAGTLSPVDLVEALLAWIEALEPQVQAWVTLDWAGALDSARRCAAEVRRGQIRGPLHGIPVG